MDQEAARYLMERAIEVAHMSQSEDDRLHPKVGAVLSDQLGKEILWSCRGQGGGHAEFALLEEAKNKNISLQDKVLFVTLEPCSRRSPGKLPCAVRVVQSGVGTVYIGMLDPNPQIIGRGVNFLIERGIAVEHFPADLRKKISDSNAAFRGQHAYLVDPIVMANDDDVVARQRAGILATTLDLIASAKGDVRLFSGDSSWLGELFVGLLEASLHGIKIQMIAQKQLTKAQYAHLAAIGIEVCDVGNDLGLRATMAMRDREPAQLVVVEPQPARHAQLFSAPHDKTILGVFARAFEANWNEDHARKASIPHLKAIPVSDVAEALQTGVSAYRTAKIELAKVNTGDLEFLTNDVEILKMRRVASTKRIMNESGGEAPFSIAGTPWAFFPPIVECNASGRMVLIDGTHRVYDALQGNRSVINAILVDGVEAKLPATPIQRFEANILPRKRSRQERYLGYDPGAFRPIRKALEVGKWTLAPNV